MTVAFKKNSMPAIRIVLFLLVLSNGCRMFALEKDTTAEYELSPEIFFADPGKPVMSAKDIAYSEQQGASGAWLDNLKIPAIWQINGGVNQKSLPLTLDFSGKRLRFSSPGSLSFYLRPSISPNHRYILRFIMEGKGTVKAGYFTYPMPGKKGLSQMKEYRCTTDSSVITVEEVLDPTTEMGHRDLRLAFTLSGDLTLRNFCLKRLPLPEGETIAEGHLEAVSKLPVPEKSDYPDCYFTAKIKLEKILSGKPVPQDMQLVIPGFYGKKATEYAKFKSGDIVRVKLVKFDSLDDKRKSIQQADDLNIFDLENYFVVGAAKTNAVSPGENVIDFSGPVFYRSPWDHPVNPPVSEEAKAAKRAFIERDLKKLNAALSDIEGKKAELNRRFSEWLKKPEGCQPLEYDGKKYWWKNCNGAFFALPQSWTPVRDGKISQQNLDALKALDEYLAMQGVQLMIQVIPNLYDIAARVMNPEFGKTVDTYSASLVKQLLENGIETVYSSDVLREHFNRFEWMFFYPDNEHPHDGCQYAITSLMKERLARYGNALHRVYDSKNFTMISGQDAYEETPDEKKRYLGGLDIGKHRIGEPVGCKHVFYKNLPLPNSPSSAILVTGNSYIQTPMPDFSYASYLSLHTGFAVHSFRINAMGPYTGIPLSLFNNPERYLRGKTVCILPMVADRFTDHLCFLDLKKLDAMNRLLAGRKKCYEFTLSRMKEQIPDLLISGSRPENVYWQYYLQETIPHRIFSKQPGEYVLASFEVPGEQTTQPSVVVVNAAPVRRKTIQIGINGQWQPLTESHREPYFSRLCFEIPPKTSKITLRIRCEQNNFSLAIRSVNLYQ